MGDYFSDLAPQVTSGFMVMADVCSSSWRNLKQVEDGNDAVGVYSTGTEIVGVGGANLVAIALGVPVRPEPVFVVNALMLVLWVVPERRIERRAPVGLCRAAEIGTCGNGFLSAPSMPGAAGSRASW